MYDSVARRSPPRCNCARGAVPAPIELSMRRPRRTNLLVWPHLDDQVVAPAHMHFICLDHAKALSLIHCSDAKNSPLLTPSARQIRRGAQPALVLGAAAHFQTGRLKLLYCGIQHGHVIHRTIIILQEEEELSSPSKRFDGVVDDTKVHERVCEPPGLPDDAVRNPWARRANRRRLIGFIRSHPLALRVACALHVR